MSIPTPSPSPAPLLTPQALCRQLSICYRSYTRLVRAGLPCIYVLTARRYDLAEVLRWLRSQAAVQPAMAQPRAWRMPRFGPADDQLVRHLKLLAHHGRRG